MHMYEKFIVILILLFDFIIAIVIYSLYLPFPPPMLIIQATPCPFCVKSYSTLFFSHAREIDKYKFNAKKQKQKTHRKQP